MDYRGLIKKKFLQNGYVLDKGSTEKSINQFFKLITDNTRKVKLQRIGPCGDGGYLVPSDLDDVKICLSPGVSDNSGFEVALAEKYNIVSHLLDASIDTLPTPHNNFKFHKKFLGSQCFDDYITLQEWVDSNALTNENNLMLQMDIEGYEYDVLSSCSSELLKKFQIMIIEFHDIERVFDRFALRFIHGIFSKILENFYIVHMHPNNSGPPWNIQNINIPRYLEITFLRKNCLEDERKDELEIPHNLDFPCVVDKDDFVLDSKFWRKS